LFEKTYNRNGYLAIRVSLIFPVAIPDFPWAAQHQEGRPPQTFAGSTFCGPVLPLAAELRYLSSKE
jgi:hypothetical protein